VLFDSYKGNPLKLYPQDFIWTGSADGKDLIANAATNFSIAIYGGREYII
jgi:hypothetical protein